MCSILPNKFIENDELKVFLPSYKILRVTVVLIKLTQVAKNHFAFATALSWH
jgi:hypothetical protein